MPVTPYCKNFFQTRHDLYQFLLSCQPTPDEIHQTQIISISFEIDPVHPLVALRQLAGASQFNFYFEKQDLTRAIGPGSDGYGIAAIDSVLRFQTEGADRFDQVKAFIQSVVERVILAGDTKLPFAGPHFFCNFSFFDHIQLESPFPAATVFLPAWQVAYQEQRYSLVGNLVISATTPLAQTVDQFWNTLQTIHSLSSAEPFPLLQPIQRLRAVDVTPTHQFKQSVQSVLALIQAEQVHKLVLAHAVDVVAPSPFQSIRALDNLRRLYPDCYIFSSGNGRGQHFLGASPERLLRLRDRQLITDTLAGSAPRGKTTCEDAYLASKLLSSPKELHEHRLVLNFIMQQLVHLGLNPQCAPLRLLQLSNIQHLQTPIHAVVPDEIHLLDILAQLHPTPAVAGVPKALACEQIHRYEAFDRSLYAAPIGWIDYHANGEFAVGIRSAVMNGCQARLYGGAGIVAGSDPDRELAEVQLKLQALLHALG